MTAQRKPELFGMNVPSDWSVRSLGELGLFSKGKGILKDDLKPFGLPCIRYGEIYTDYGFVASEFHSRICKTVAAESKEIEMGDLLFAGSGETVDEIGKAVAYVGKEPAYAGGDVIVLSLNQDVDAICISYALESGCARRQKRVLGQGNSIVHIYPRDLAKVRVALPPIAEQKAIARVLGLMDEVINKNNQLIAQKELRKKWLMQILLTGRKRIKGFDNEWQTVKLGEVITPAIRPVEKPKRSFLALGIRSHGKGTFLKPDFDPEKIEMETLYVVRENDLIVNITFAWEQAIAIAGIKDDGALVSHRFPTFTFNQAKGIVDFFRHFILQKRFKAMMDLISPGGAGRNRVLSKRDFLNLRVNIPSVSEQTEIARVLQAADTEILVLRSKTENLKKQKQWLMQQLLTGKKRLKVNENEEIG